MVNIDLTGTKCPVTIMRFRAAMHKLPRGEKASVQFDDMSFENDLKSYCRKAGASCTKVEDGLFEVTKSKE